MIIRIIDSLTEKKIKHNDQTFWSYVLRYEQIFGLAKRSNAEFTEI